MLFRSIAHDYLLTNQIEKAKELLDKAESIMKYEFGGIRRGRPDTSLWIARGEAEFYAYKSMFYLRIGKSEDAMNMGRIALEKSKEMLKLVSTLDSDLYRTFARRTAAQVAGNIVSQQIAMGQFVNAELSLRDAFKLARDNGFNDSHMFLFHVLSSDIMNGTSQYKLGLQYAQKSEKTFLSQGYSKVSANWMRSKSQIGRAHV